MENRYCSLCGAPIGVNNPDGLGGECRKAINDAKFKAIFEIEGNSLLYWLIMAKETKEVFIRMFSETKFRSDFNKSFYDSIKKSERTSKKQLEIMCTKIVQKDFQEYTRMNENIVQKKKQFINDQMKIIVLSREQIEQARRSLRK